MTSLSRRRRSTAATIFLQSDRTASIATQVGCEDGRLELSTLPHFVPPQKALLVPRFRAIEPSSASDIPCVGSAAQPNNSHKELVKSGGSGHRFAIRLTHDRNHLLVRKSRLSHRSL